MVVVVVGGMVVVVVEVVEDVVVVVLVEVEMLVDVDDGSTVVADVHATTAKRIRLKSRNSDVATTYHEPKHKPPDCAPHQREALAHRVDRWYTRNQENRRERYPADDAHQEGSKQVVRSRKETADQTAYRSRATNDEQCLKCRSFEEHVDRLNRASTA